MQSGLFVGCTQLDDCTPVLVLDVAGDRLWGGHPARTAPAVRHRHRRRADRARGLRVVLFRALDGERLGDRDERRRASRTAPHRRPCADRARMPRSCSERTILALAGVPEGIDLPERLIHPAPRRRQRTDRLCGARSA